jgi:hypothetical protein
VGLSFAALLRQIVIWLTLASFLAVQTAAVADPHDEGVAAGQAANPLARGSVDASSASAVVPGYTATPPEISYGGQPNLSGQSSAQLAACALTPNDPVCQALLGALASAHTPREAISPNDPAVLAGQQIANNPAAVLQDLASYYSGCQVVPGSSASNCPANAFCLAGGCFNTAYTNDADFARSMSFLEVAREAGVYLDTDAMQVFKGEANHCRDRLLKNCCYADGAGKGMTNQSMFGTGSRLVFDVLMNAGNRQFLYQGMQALLLGGGFSGSFTTYGVTVAVNGAALPAGSVAVYSGQSMIVAVDPWSLAIAVVIYIVMSMMSCNEEEGKLAMKEGAKLCHAIGTYCSSCIRVLGACISCIEHTTSKCCFNSVLARLVNEQGRLQVGKGWGTANTPDCSGFTIAQLQSLDFGHMDLTEFYASIVPTLPNVGAIQNSNSAGAVNCYYGQGRCQ